MKFLLTATAIATATATAILFTSTEAFNMMLPGKIHRPIATALKLESGDGDGSQAAVEAALEASRQYGTTSKEAAVAWDIVEEMRASDNRLVAVSYF